MFQRYLKIIIRVINPIIAPIAFGVVMKASFLPIPYKTQKEQLNIIMKYNNGETVCEVLSLNMSLI